MLSAEIAHPSALGVAAGVCSAALFAGGVRQTLISKAGDSKLSRAARLVLVSALLSAHTYLWSVFALWAVPQVSMALFMTAAPALAGAVAAWEPVYAALFCWIEKVMQGVNALVVKVMGVMRYARPALPDPSVSGLAAA